MAFVTVPVIDIIRSRLHGEPVGMRIVSFVKDEVSYLAGIVGTALAAAGHAWADPVASLVIGVLVGVGGILLVRDSILCLAGKSL
jgi:divalent metal cation (Fe/Co/Zn/Cd) transporter